MVARWAEGFESHRISTQQSRKYASNSGTWTFPAGRTFGFAGGPQSAVYVTPSLASSQNTWTIGFGARVVSHSAALDDASNNGLYFEDDGTQQFRIGFYSTNGVGWGVKIYRGATELVATTTFTFNVWQYIEVQVLINDTTGTYEIRRNGVLEDSDTAQNTADNGNTGANGFAFRFGDNLASFLHLDDLYILDDTGSVNNDFLGPRIVEAIEVTANGNQNDWINDDTGVSDSNNFGQVDDPGQTSPNDSAGSPGGYIRSDTNTDLDLYAMSNLTQITGAVNFVQVGIQATMAAAGSRVLRFKFRDGVSGNANGDSFTVDDTTYDEFIQIWDENPATGPAAWDVAEIDAGEMGVEVVS